MSLEEIKEKLCAPIYNHFDYIIKFDDFSDDTKTKIAEDYLRTLKEDIRTEISKEKLFNLDKKLNNAGGIQYLIRYYISVIEIRKICEETVQNSI